MRGKSKGFTLIEAAIVFVIVGLIVGGILLARSMITTSEVQSFTRQVSQLDLAIEGFQTKYNSLPGDSNVMTPAGNNNSKIESTGTPDLGATFNGEVANFWAHVSSVGGIKSKTGFTATLSGPLKVEGNTTSTPNVPKSAMSSYKDAGVIVSHDNGDLATYGLTGAYIIGRVNEVTDSTPSIAFDNIGDAFKPADVQALDSKADDGLANLGAVQAFTRQTGAADCFVTGDRSRYDTSLDTPACSVAIKYMKITSGQVGQPGNQSCATETCASGETWNADACACEPDGCSDPGYCNGSGYCGEWNATSCNCDWPSSYNACISGGNSYDMNTCSCQSGGSCNDPGDCSSQYSCGQWWSQNCACGGPDMNYVNSCPTWGAGYEFSYSNCSCYYNGAPAPYCGDASCDSGNSEDCSTCPSDCGSCYCGDGSCNNGEDGCTCGSDCGVCYGCGDASCNNGEDCNSCSQDCGNCEVCGDWSCSGSENCWSCSNDCGSCGPTCGDANCDSGGGENCSNCSSDCGSCEYCGDMSCNNSENCWSCSGDCGSCGPYCGDGNCNGGNGEDCNSCSTDCGSCGPSCGDGSCDGGESCSSCSNDCGSCPYCGDGSCNNSESCSDCPSDCGTCGYCGDLACDSGEDCNNCSSDCGSCGPYCGDNNCDSGSGEDCNNCPADCPSCDFCGDMSCTGAENCYYCSSDCGSC